LIEEWLMKNDFQPVVGHKVNFRATPMAHWNGVTDCEALVVEPREIKTKATYVGGNTHILGIRANKDVEQCFNLKSPVLMKESNRYMWELDEILLSATRVSLDRHKPGQATLLAERIELIRERLEALRADSNDDSNRTSPEDTIIEITEYGTQIGDPFKDL
jgi:hypothetical protein